MRHAGLPRGAARPRTATTEAIRDACLAELTDRGYHSLSMESVARRAGVGKAALYRRWPDKNAMVADIVGKVTRAFLAPIEFGDGDLEDDLCIYAEVVHHWLQDPRIIADLISAGTRDEQLFETLTYAVSTAIDPSRRSLHERAASRGDANPDGATTDIAGIIFWRRAALGQELSPDELKRIARQAARSLTTAAGPGRDDVR